MDSKFTKESFYSVPRETVFAFHEQPDAFRLLTPPSSNVEVLSTASTLRPSADIVRFISKFLFLKFKFEMVHTEYEEGVRFVDEQRKGLFSSWRHEHQFKSGGWEEDPASLLRDQIVFSHPLLPLFKPFVTHQLKGLFQYRHGETRKAMESTTGDGNPRSLTVIVTGATGLIGKRVTEILVEKGARVIVFTRNEKKARKLFGSSVTYSHWDLHHPDDGDWKEHLEKADSVVHLAGTPLFKQRWTPAFKEEIEQSRVQSTRQLVEAIRSAKHKPASFIAASAVGIYGTDPNREVDETSSSSDDLLSRICIHWEEEAKKVEQEGVRGVQIRIGVVLSSEAGALKEVLPVFRMGGGGVMGDPDHFINWIHIEDVARIFVMAITNNDMDGPFNAVAPDPERNADYYRKLSRVLKRPFLMKYPPAIMKMMLGEAGEYASGGARVSANKIQKAGYRFFFSDLESALENALS